MKTGKTRLEVLTGDITKADTEAVVNPANNMLWTGGGISAAIRKAGGESIESEALSKAPAEIGSAVVTGGGALEARWVLHAVIFGQDLSTNEEFIRRAVRACYEKAGEIHCKSIAMPLLDSGAFDVEVHLAAHIIVDETVDYFIKENSSIERIVFVEHDEKTKDIFSNALYDKFSKHG